MRFNYLNLCTFYGFKVTNPKTGEVLSHMTNDFNQRHPNRTPCFAKYFRIENRQAVDSEFKVLIGIGTEFLKDSSNNYCFLNTKEIEEYLNLIKEVVDFTYELKILSKSRISITAKFKKTNLFHSKWVVSSIRALYEFPSSYALKEAMEFRHHPAFKDDNIFNIFNTILFAIASGVGEQTVVSFGYDRTFRHLNTKELIKTIDSESKSSDKALNNIYPKIPLNKKDKVYQYLGCLNEHVIKYLDSYTMKKVMYSPRMLSMRLEKVYIPLYKIFKNL